MNDLMSYLPNLLSGLGITLMLMLGALVFGFLLSICMITIDYLGAKLIRKVIATWVFFICGTPLLVQIFLIYFGSGQFELIRDSYLWFALRNPMVCAVVALAINTSCYTFVLIKSAIDSIPRNEIEACAAIGMSKCLSFRKIILPRALRLFLPAYSNEVIIVLKSTSLASTITILDLMGVTQELISQTYSIVEFYLLAGAVYLCLAAILVYLFRKLSRLSHVQI